jgi:hypothetical protein
MSTSVGDLFGEIGRILCVCPECSDLFYLSEARPYLDGRRPRSIVDTFRAEEIKLDRAEEKLDEIESELREAAARLGLRAAKRALKKIDPGF